MLGIHFCVRVFFSLGVQAAHCSGSLLRNAGSKVLRLSSYGSRAQVPLGMWSLPEAGIEPMSPKLADRFSAPGAPGKSCLVFLVNGPQPEAF